MFYHTFSEIRNLSLSANWSRGHILECFHNRYNPDIGDWRETSIDDFCLIIKLIFNISFIPLLSSKIAIKTISKYQYLKTYNLEGFVFLKKII